MCQDLAKTQILCGRAEGVLRPSLGLTHPGWELRCRAYADGNAVSIFVTNQIGASGDPLPQPEVPLELAQVQPIIAVLLSFVQR